jgi:hypothetical protein
MRLLVSGIQKCIHLKRENNNHANEGDIFIDHDHGGQPMLS